MLPQEATLRRVGMDLYEIRADDGRYLFIGKLTACLEWLRENGYGAEVPSQWIKRFDCLN